MTSSNERLPTPTQIREDPERVALYGLGHAIELTLRVLAAVNPGLGQGAEPRDESEELSSAEVAAEQIVVAATALDEAIRGYLGAIDLERSAKRADPIDEDLPF